MPTIYEAAALLGLLLFLAGLRDLFAQQRRLLDSVLRILEILETKLRPQRPQNARVTLIGENPMADQLQYKVGLDAPGADSDVVKRKLTVTVDGAARDPLEVGKDEAFPDLFVPQDSQVKLAFVNIDDAGLESAPLEYEFQAKDTLPPGQPTGVSVALVGEQEAGGEYTPPADPVAPPTEEPTT